MTYTPEQLQAMSDYELNLAVERVVFDGIRPGFFDYANDHNAAAFIIGEIERRGISAMQRYLTVLIDEPETVTVFDSAIELPGQLPPSGYAKGFEADGYAFIWKWHTASPRHIAIAAILAMQDAPAQPPAAQPRPRSP